jgi:hypothetical protein
MSNKHATAGLIRALACAVVALALAACGGGRGVPRTR